MRTVAGQVFLLQIVTVLLLVAAAVVALVLQARHDTTLDARQRSLAAAEAFAHSPGMVQALRSPNPTAVLQPLAEQARKGAGVDAIVVSNTAGIRYTHPDPNLIGKHVIGPRDLLADVMHGKTATATFAGSQGPSVVSVVPVTKADGSVVGIVSAGVKVETVNSAVMQHLPVVFGSAAAALLLATGGSALVGRRLRLQTHGLGPAEMTRMYEHHTAVLHAVREGVLIVGGDGRLVLANDEARRLLDLPADAEQRLVGELGLGPEMADLLVSGRAATDEVHPAGERLLAVNVRTTDPHGGGLGGVVATLRDTTELRALAGRAEVARQRLRLLYDAGVRIGTTLDVKRTAEELAEVAVPRFADFVTVELLDPVLRGEEPAGAHTEMRRAAVRGIRDDAPLYPVGQLIRFHSADHPIAAGRPVLEPDLAASESWCAQDPERAQRVLDYGIHSLISVPLQARGVVLGMADFWRSGHEPFEHDDLSAAEELAARAALAIDNARRYTREHTMAVTLQRSLLPRTLPDQSALEAAHRYLPARAGVGGDWFDIIPLPGARVALVVGDVVGHGLHAAATMGRLRTAVHNFSALDLAPDELLSHLDELVTHLDSDQAADGEDEPAVTGATCLYAVYDPVTGRAEAATAGHLGPALVAPDGTVTFPEVPISPPLGLGAGLPFETAELQLSAGSQLVLYTDGLVEDRDRDLDTGLDLLRSALAGHPDRTPEETCQAVLDALLPERPRDDVALLVARTRLLDPERVATWDVPADPAAVSTVRGEAARRLESWGLEEIGFTTELIISELVTNAIRYGTQPIRLRLLHDRDHLICEVADGSNTSPHLRRAKTTDEGGRGLFLVAQFAQRWGTRYTARGKIIWTEQTLGATEPSADLTDVLLDQWDE
ncbi:SpoIIE family protein phosphatase [Streptomyces sp. NPDC046821]|uniref:SpoIIE family protein phosphatase n=1 Tax=Streptomyces sp. NPDC046821 TaxID=3154702 RepID=UPI0033C0CC7E